MNDYDADPYDDPFSLSEPVAPSADAPAPIATPNPVPPLHPQPMQPTPTGAGHAAPPQPYRPPPPGGLQHAGFTCPFCAYDLTGAVIGGSCPECGAHITPTALTSTATNAMAVTSMVLGILSLALCIFYGIFTIILAPLGIIFGHIARGQIRSGRYSSGSASFALTGLICSYIGLGLVATVALTVTILVML